MQSSAKNTPIYFRNLDGLRFIAALFVIVGHCQSMIVEHLNINPYVHYADKLASFGVDFFFVLSGFLISFLLFEENQKTGTIHIRKFYIRRILRLWPLYFIFGVGSILTATYYMHYLNLLDRPQTWEEMRTNLLYLTFFSTNFQILIGMDYPGSFTIGHFWSLSVEEQFYLIWAPLMFLFRKRIWLLLLLMTAIGIITNFWQPDIYQKWFGTNAPSTAYYATYSRFMYFGFGATLAYLIHKKMTITGLIGIKEEYLKYFHIGFSIITLVCSYYYLFKPYYFSFLKERFINNFLSVSLVLTAIMRYTVLNLEFSLLKYLGKISFGIYVFHFLSIRIVWYFLQEQHVSDRTIFIFLPILSTLLAVLFAMFSYQFIESWFLKQKHKFTF